MSEKLIDLKYDIQHKVASAINEAYQASQSEDVAQIKAELEETLKHAQEAYEFFKVVMNRMHHSDNNLESTTMSYLRVIGSHLSEIKGIKK